MINFHMLTGIDRKGVFWQNKSAYVLSDSTHPFEHYITPYGLVIPVTASGYHLLRLYKILQTASPEEINRILPRNNTESVAAVTVISYDGEIYSSILMEVSDKFIYLDAKQKHPPKTGWMISSLDQNLNDALQVVSDRFKDYKKLLEFYHKNFYGKADIKNDYHYITYENLKKMKPDNPPLIGNHGFKFDKFT